MKPCKQVLRAIMLQHHIGLLTNLIVLVLQFVLFAVY
jgi:hypothetical protein